MSSTQLQNKIGILLVLLLLAQPSCSVQPSPSLLEITPLSSQNSISYSSASLTSTQEFVINETIKRDQHNPWVTIMTNGDFYVVWEGDNKSYDSVFSRFYQIGETATTHNLEDLVEWYEEEISYLYGTDQEDPVVAYVTGNNVAITWKREYKYFFGDQVFMRIFDRFGTSEFNEIRVSSGHFKDNVDPNVAVLTNGNIVITWVCDDCDDDYDIVYVKMFNESGEELGDEFQVNQSSAESAEDPVVVPLDDGGFLIAWTSELEEEEYEYTYVKRYDADGNSLGIEQQVNGYGSEGDDHIHGVQLLNGDIVFVYESDDRGDNEGDGIFARIFNSTMDEIKAEFTVSSRIDDDQRAPKVARLADGGFFVVWEGDSSESVRGRRFNSTWEPVGEDIVVSDRGDEIGSISIASSDDYFIIVWEAEIDELDDADIIGKLFFLTDDGGSL